MYYNTVANCLFLLLSINRLYISIVLRIRQNDIFQIIAYVIIVF
jgi:hypothetical protein